MTPVDALVHLTQLVIVLLIVAFFANAFAQSLVGRVACLVGWHAWTSRTERDRDLLFTFNRCERGCRQYGLEFIVDFERLEPPFAGCSCRKHLWSPNCLVHGRQDAA